MANPDNWLLLKPLGYYNHPPQGRGVHASYTSSACALNGADLAVQVLSSTPVQHEPSQNHKLRHLVLLTIQRLPLNEVPPHEMSAL